jgi:hypothetical protein
LGGSSPFANPQVAFATRNGADNSIPSFIKSNGPVREVRFKENPDGSPDGGVHSLFTITGSPAVRGCQLSQPDFASAVANGNGIILTATVSDDGAQDKQKGAGKEDNVIRLGTEALIAIAEELRRQYSLGYYPKTEAAAGPDGSRQIRVKVKQGNLAVKARDSYTTKSAPATPTK